MTRRSLGVMTALLFGISAIVVNTRAADPKSDPFLDGRIVAIGIPGVSAISAVGTFLPGGPIHDNPAFAVYTQPGRVLDPNRILVGSTSNFGAPLASPNQLPGSFLSIDPLGPILIIPPLFAADGGQSTALGGRVQMYSAQSPPFLNSIHTPAAATASFTGVSNPLGLSVNNAFGRLWPANAPTGLNGPGTSTILDPTGEPLAGAPNQRAGGVFAGNATPRLPVQVLAGALNTGAVGTAFLGKSPDGSNRAVFAVILADGSIVQAHTEQAVDGLAPVGTVRPLLERGALASETQARGTTLPRLGAVLNYSPTRILYVTEPFDNSIVAIKLQDDGAIFRVASLSRFQSPALDEPVDMAPAEIETENPDWSSNTTMEEGSDFYVANRGNNTIVRMRQDGTVAAVKTVRLASGAGLARWRLNGIATSPDGRRIWVTVSSELPVLGNLVGAVLELPAF